MERKIVVWQRRTNISNFEFGGGATLTKARCLASERTGQPALVALLDCWTAPLPLFLARSLRHARCANARGAAAGRRLRRAPRTAELLMLMHVRVMCINSMYVLPRSKLNCANSVPVCGVRLTCTRHYRRTHSGQGQAAALTVPAPPAAPRRF
jgi:hypothetical protein